VKGLGFAGAAWHLVCFSALPALVPERSQPKVSIWLGAGTGLCVCVRFQDASKGQALLVLMPAVAARGVTA
jgi:hypothetical protein